VTIPPHGPLRSVKRIPISPLHVAAAGVLLLEAVLVLVVSMALVPILQTRQDKARYRELSRQLVSAFWYTTTDMDALSYDWGTWDAMADAVQQWTPAFAYANLPPAVCTDFNLDMVVILDRDFRSLCMRTHPRTAALPVSMTEARRTVTDVVRKHGPVLKRLIFIHCVPALIVSTPIRYQDEEFDRLPPEGYMVLVRMVSSDDADRLSVLMQRPISFRVSGLTVPCDAALFPVQAPGPLKPIRSRGDHMEMVVPVPALPTGTRLLMRTEELRVLPLSAGRITVTVLALFLCLNLLSALLYLELQRRRRKRLRFMLHIVDRISSRLYIQPRQVDVTDDIEQLHAHLDNLFFNIQRMQRERELMHSREIIREKLISLGRVAADLSHEILTPVRVMRNCLGPIRRKLSLNPTETERDRKMLDMMERELGQMEAMADHLLAFFREESEHGEPVQLIPVVRRAMERFQTLESDCELDLNLPTEATVFASGKQLEQVLLNLFRNSAEAGASRVRVWLEIHDDRAALHIKDDGPGIPETDRDRIFEPFFSRKHARGVGLGLNISYNIVRSFHGDLYLEHQDPTPGAHFVLELPLMDARDDTEDLHSHRG